MRIPPSLKTLKKLFALSGNKCAFPDCKQTIVDKDQNLIGIVCHIQAAGVKGERYNPDQTDKERANFDNLILLCSKHHIVTNDVKKYTVDILKDIKKKHESMFVTRKYNVTDDFLKKVSQTFNQRNINNGNGQQIVYQVSGPLVVKNSSGVTASDVVSIVQGLFEANFPILLEKASQKAEENVNKFKAEISKQVGIALNADDLVNFSEPDVQYILNEAVTMAAKSDDDELRKTLSKLVVTRVKENNVDIKRLVLNGAISTAGKLTINQMKVVTLCFMTKNTRFMGIRTWDNLKIEFELKIKPFVEITGTNAELLYLQYTGCGNVQGYFSNNIIENLRNTYGAVFLNSYNDEEIKGLGLPQDLTKELFVNVSERTIPNVDGVNELKDYLKDKGINTTLIDNAVSVYNSKLPSVEDVTNLFEKEVPWSKEFFEIYKNIIDSLVLTSVGMAIAIAFYEQQIGQPLNMEKWIN